VLSKDSEGRFTATKTSEASGMDVLLQREIKILKMMNHPLVVRINERCSEANNQNQAVVTNFVANGSLADHLPDAENGDVCQLRGSTRIVRIIAGIVLAMRYIHSQEIIHNNLTPDNVLLDLNWNVRICLFGSSVSPDHPKHQAPADPNGLTFWPEIISRYAAPETYNDITVKENDVFSFGMILYELIVGRPVFPKDMNPYQVALLLIEGSWRLDIPDTVSPRAEELIRDCLAVDYRDRPSFDDILERLTMIGFRLMADVNSVKIVEFVAGVEYWECESAIPGQGATSQATALADGDLFDAHEGLSEEPN
jgi:serine/threonine protein kinase